MKRYIISLACTLCLALNVNAMDYETARNQAYYLTDKMAYELNLSDAQYNDAYEINLDYFLSLNSPADIDAIYLRHRNDDLRFILHDWQWSMFLSLDYFLSPVRWLSGAWYFPIYRYYTHSFFFFDRPHIFWNYRGGHGRAHFGGRSFYDGRRSAWNGGMRGSDRGMVGRPIGCFNGRDGAFWSGTRGSGGTCRGVIIFGYNRGGNNSSVGTSRGGNSIGTSRGGSNSSVGTNRGSNSGVRSSSRTTVGTSRSTSGSSSRSSIGTSRSSSSNRSSIGTSRSSGGSSRSSVSSHSSGGSTRSSVSSHSSGGGSHSGGGSRGGGGGGSRGGGGGRR